MADETQLATSQTRMGESLGASAFDHGRFAPGMVLAERYRIVGLLGRGGMGEVYRADDLTLGQSVALKFLPSGIDTDRAALERLLGEVRTARQVSHPNVCRVHDVGEVGGRRFISMEYVDGEDLSVLLRRIGRLPADKGVEIARQLCAGLGASHERGVLHRDLKPANIMLDGRGRVRITDFGLATALQADGKGVGEFAGTPAYMAPEQLDGKPVTVQTDIYALGLVLYELFTGKRFHDVAGLAQLRERHAETTSIDLSTSEAVLDPAVARVIERCLDPEPRRRPGSCALVAASLPGGDPLAAAIAAGETPSPQLVAAAAVQGALSPRMAAILGAAFLVLVGVVAVWKWNPAPLFGLTRSAEVLSAQTRDLLVDLGYPEPPVDTAAGFRYRYVDWRDPAITRTDRPWARLAELRPASIFFWYREQATPMAGFEAGRIGPEILSLSIRGVAGISPFEPLPEPGSIYVERAPDGALDTLVVRPRDGQGPPQAVAGAPPFDWSHLFAEARLDMATFATATPDPTLALPGDQRVAWQRPSADPQLALRIEAAALAGRPVAFRVMSPRTIHELGATPFSLAQRGATYAGLVAATMMLFAAYLATVYFMRRNAQLGRGDRRGAARLARVIGGLAFVASLFFAAPPLDLRLVGTLHGAAAIGLFAGALCWTFYMAIEPFVRRQWPRVLVGWSRLMAGEWRDPQVGREVFIGALTSVASVALLTVTNRFLVAAPEPSLGEEMYVRALSSTRELLSGLMQLAPWTMVVVLFWMVLLLWFRRLFRSDIAAIGVLSVVSIAITPPSAWPMGVALLITNVAALSVALRVGFLALVVAILTTPLIIAYPFTPGAPGFIGSLSWIPVAVFVVPSLFALYIALAGQSIFGDERDGDHP